MEMVEQVLSYFRFDTIELIGILLFGFLFLIQLFYYLNYYRKPYAYAKNLNSYEDLSDKPSKLKVSVIIVSENEADSLTENLPTILNQDYPDFEVIVVNNGSTDESDVLLTSLELNYPNLYHTYLPYSNDKMLSRYKLALTLGVKAAKGDVLLFTQPYCKPVSDKWISALVRGFSENKEVVLGYSFYQKKNRFYNRMARFGNHIFSMQYLSRAVKGKPYVGTFRNIAFRKHLFFDNKGFASNLHLELAEDILINEIMTKDNTSVSLSQDSFIEIGMHEFSLWKQIKRSYSLSKTYLKGKAPVIFGIESFSGSIFYLLFIGLTVYSAVLQHWALLGITIFFFLLRLCTQYAVLTKSARYFNSGKFIFSLPLLDFLAPYYNIRFKTRYRGLTKVIK
jgi:glycosyltransferase involved in cell wall biosynthesis